MDSGHRRFIKRVKPEYSEETNKISGSNPYRIFRRWLIDAHNSKNPEANAMILSTVSKKNHPDARVVLLKKLSKFKLTFFTHYESKKASDVLHCRRVCAVFYWGELERQVRIFGTAKRTSKKINDLYFSSRPRDSQLAAWASSQSKQLPSKEYMRKKLYELGEAFMDTPIPCPPFWGGYDIDVDCIEFWQGRKNRLHDRVKFKKSKDIWKKSLLFP